MHNKFPPLPFDDPTFSYFFLKIHHLSPLLLIKEDSLEFFFTFLLKTVTLFFWYFFSQRNVFPPVVLTKGIHLEMARP